MIAIKNNAWISIIILLFSCQHEETLSPRDHPFLTSLDIHSIDETGVSVDFEISNESKSVISSYGVEYSETGQFVSDDSPKNIYKAELKSGPKLEKETVRILYDLVAGKEYLVRPFVVSGSNTVYGKSLFFTSKGVNEPEITAISDSTLMNSSEIIISGNYFNSRLELNKVEIPGLEEYFKIEVVSATHQELKIKLSRTSLPFSLNDAKITKNMIYIVSSWVISLSYLLQLILLT